MQQAIILEAKIREALGNKVRALRRTGVMPAVLYGKGIASQNLAIDARAFEKVYKEAGESTLVDLKVGDGQPIKVLIQDITKHHLTLKPIHADFYQVSMTEKLTATVPLKFIGEAAAVKELGGILVKNLQEVRVECLPQDLVHEIEIDLSLLKTFEDSIDIKSIKVPAGITILNKPDESVVLVQVPVQEEEVVGPSEKEQIEGIEKEVKKKEKEEDAPEGGDKKEEKKKEEKKKE